MKTPFFSLRSWAWFLSFVCISWLARADIANVDKTWQIVVQATQEEEEGKEETKQDLKKYSITNGAIAWETGWLNNFHRFANFYPVESQDYRGRTVIGYDPDKTDTMTKLVRILFHRVPGSTSYADFSSTDFVKPKDEPEKIAQLVAQVVVGLDHFKKQIMAFKDTYGAVQKDIKDLENSTDQKVAAGIRDLKKHLENFDKTLNLNMLDQTKSLFESSARRKVKRESPLASNKDLFDALKKLQEATKEIKPWSDALLALLIFSKEKYLKVVPTEFVNIIAGALHDSDPDNPDALYPENLVHMIWLGFLYKALEKASGTEAVKNRIAMQVYYDIVGKLVNQKLDLPLEVILPTSIKPLNAQNILQRYLKSPDLIVQKLDSFLFYSIKSRLFPTLVGYAETKYKPFKDSEAVFTFPDCMENSIANFIRTMSYDLEFGAYKLSTLEKRLGDLDLDEERADKLAHFFKNPLDHDFWVALVSNIPYVPYLQAGNRDGKPIVRDKNKRAFVHVDDEVKAEYEADGYQVITSPEEAVFELKPSLRALIIVLDHLLGLDLFKENLAKEGLRADFVKYYFPLLCKQIHLEGYYGLTPDAEADEQEKIEDVDTIDKLGEEKIYIFFSRILSELNDTKLTHKFSTHIKHGEYEFSVAQSIKSALENVDKTRLLKLIKNQAIDLGGILLLEYLDLDLADEMLRATSYQEQYAALFALPVYNPDSARDIIDYIDSLARNTKEYRSTAVVRHSHLGKFALQLALAQPDREQRSLMLFLLARLKLSNMDEDLEKLSYNYLIKGVSEDKKIGAEIIRSLLKKNKTVANPTIILQELFKISELPFGVGEQSRETIAQFLTASKENDALKEPIGEVFYDPHNYIKVLKIVRDQFSIEGVDLALSLFAKNESLIISKYGDFLLKKLAAPFFNKKLSAEQQKKIEGLENKRDNERERLVQQAVVYAVENKDTSIFASIVQFLKIKGDEALLAQITDDLIVKTNDADQGVAIFAVRLLLLMAHVNPSFPILENLRQQLDRGFITDEALEQEINKEVQELAAKVWSRKEIKD